MLFWHLGHEVQLDPGTLIESGRPVAHLSALVDGEVDVHLTRGNLRTLAPALLGEMSYVSGDDAVASATVTNDGPIVVRRWEKEGLADRWVALKHGETLYYSDQ